MLLGLAIIGGLALKNLSSIPKPKTSTPVLVKKAIPQVDQDFKAAKQWEKNGNESLANKNYEDADSQFLKALDFYEATNEADSADIVRMRASLAKAKEGARDFVGAHKQWKLAFKLDPEQKPNLKKIEKKIRNNATSINDRAQKLLDEKKPAEARKKAKSAYKIFKAYSGSKSQLARSLHLLAESDLAEAKFEESLALYGRAEKLSPDEACAQTIYELAVALNSWE